MQGEIPLTWQACIHIAEGVIGAVKLPSFLHSVNVESFLECAACPATYYAALLSCRSAHAAFEASNTFKAGLCLQP